MYMNYINNLAVYVFHRNHGEVLNNCYSTAFIFANTKFTARVSTYKALLTLQSSLYWPTADRGYSVQISIPCLKTHGHLPRPRPHSAFCMNFGRDEVTASTVNRVHAHLYDLKLLSVELAEPSQFFSSKANLLRFM